MAKKKTPAAEEFPSGEVLAELKTLLNQRDRRKRSQSAWHLIMRASHHSDFPVVMDFALENGLIHALDGAGM